MICYHNFFFSLEHKIWEGKTTIGLCYAATCDYTFSCYRKAEIYIPITMMVPEQQQPQQEQQRRTSKTKMATSTATPSAASIHMKLMKPLRKNFIPGPFDVICAKGNQAKNHSGNRRFRLQVQEALTRYSQAESKVEKSILVSQIVDAVRKASPLGGFVKQLDEDGLWYEVGDHLAREKVGQSFRDLLHSKYSSSTKAKRMRKRRERIKQLPKLEHNLSLTSSTSSSDGSSSCDWEKRVQSHDFIRQRTQQLSSLLQEAGDETSEEHIFNLLVQANSDFLHAFKTDQSLLPLIH